MRVSRRLELVIDPNDGADRGVAAICVVLDAIDRHLELDRDSDRLPEEVRDAVRSIRDALWRLALGGDR